MNPLEIPQEEYDRLSCHLSLLASEFDSPNRADQKIRDSALHYGEKYFTQPGVVTRADISGIREFLMRHGRDPDAIPPAMQIRPANDGWISIAERLPELPAAATETSVDVRHVVDDEVVESTARFVNEQSSLNPVGAPCFVLLGRRIDLLNPHDEGPVLAALIEPTHWRPREA